MAATVECSDCGTPRLWWVQTCPTCRVHPRRGDCTACGYPFMPDGTCIHCDRPCHIGYPNCRACATAAPQNGAGPGSWGPVPGRWPDGGQIGTA